MKKALKNILPAVAVALLVFAVPETADAQGWVAAATESATRSALQWLVQAVFLTASTIVGFLIMFGAVAMDLMIGMNLNVTNSELNPIMTSGWQITRDLANLGFVLALILIAFATILRFREYGAKKLLVRFIAVAIIVNFSFVIAGAFINFSHTVTAFFLSEATEPVPGMDAMNSVNDFLEQFGLDTGYRLSSRIVAGFKIQQLGSFEGEFDVEEAMTISGATGLMVDTLATFIYTLIGLAFVIIFSALLTFVLMAFAVMLLIRYVYLTILVILAPLAWLFWVIPTFQKHYSAWWNKFISWTFFMPAVMFFVYLSIIGMQSLPDQPSDCQGGIGADSYLVGTIQCIMGYGMQMVVITALLIGGLIAAQSLGIRFAGAALGAAESIAKGGGKAAAGGAWRATKQKGKDYSKGAQKARQRVTSKQYAGTAGGPKTKEKSAEERLKELNEKQGGLKGGTDHPEYRKIGQQIDEAEREVEEAKKETKKVEKSSADIGGETADVGSETTKGGGEKGRLGKYYEGFKKRSIFIQTLKGATTGSLGELKKQSAKMVGLQTKVEKIRDLEKEVKDHKGYLNHLGEEDKEEMESTKEKIKDIEETLKKLKKQ